MIHQPLNRQSDVFAREGIAIDTLTLADRVGACAVALAPIVDATGVTCWRRIGPSLRARSDVDLNAAALRGIKFRSSQKRVNQRLLWNKTLSVPSGLVGSTPAVQQKWVESGTTAVV